MIIRRLGLVSLFVAALALAACSEDTTPTTAPTRPSTATASPSATAAPSETATATATIASTGTPTQTATGTPTAVTTPDATTVADNFPLDIEQTDGETLTLAAPPARIVSLSAYATAILCAADAGDQLAAVDLYANCPAGSKTLPELDSFAPSLEAIAAYNPDLVYVDTDNGGIVAALRNVDIPVLYLSIPQTIDASLERIQLFASLSGHGTEGAALVSGMQDRIDATVSKLDGVTEGPTVYHELDQTLFSVGPDSYVGDFYTLLKAKNIAAGASEQYPQLTAEAILAADPEVIVLADEPFGVTVESVASRPGWDGIKAVKDGRICSVDPSLVSQPGPNLVDALDAIAACLYPDLFP